MSKKFGILFLPLLLISGCSKTVQGPAEVISVPINRIDDTGVLSEIGTVTLKDTPQGLELMAVLRGLPAGEHGFHVHENPDCGVGQKDGETKAGLAAGGHLMASGDEGSKHLGPKGAGHLGDLPPLLAAINGACESKVLAPRLKLADVKNRSLMIHASGDNFSDEPLPLGGGGARIACGVIK